MAPPSTAARSAAVRGSQRAASASRAAPASRPVTASARPRRAATERRRARAAQPGARARRRPRRVRLVDSLLYGRGWIALVGVLLVGIVFFNVDLLQMNRELARIDERGVRLKRENARLRLDLARLSSSERIQQAAVERGLVLPAAGEVRYLDATPALDARRAAKRIEARQP